jgi:hypothetical protein
MRRVAVARYPTLYWRKMQGHMETHQKRGDLKGFDEYPEPEPVQPLKPQIYHLNDA